MSELKSALPGASFEGSATIVEAGLRGMITVKGDLTDPAFADAVADCAGVPFPGQRETRFSGDRGLLWMAPDEVLVMTAHEDAPKVATALTDRLAGQHHLVCNVSDARAIFRLEGPGAREVLAKLSPADVHPSVFQPGEVRRTRLAQVAAAFWIAPDGAIELVSFRSVAEYVFGIMTNAAKPASSVGIF